MFSQLFIILMGLVLIFSGLTDRDYINALSGLFLALKAFITLKLFIADKTENIS